VLAGKVKLIRFGRPHPGTPQHSSKNNKMSYSIPKELKAMNNEMMVFYKGTGLQFHKKMFSAVLRQAKASNFGEEMSTKDMLEQLDIMERAICSTHTNSGGDPKDVMKKAMPNNDPVDCVIVWFLNIVCLLHRGAIKNDAMNGYLFFNVQEKKPSTL
jgi:hypothetical protein